MVVDGIGNQIINEQSALYPLSTISRQYLFEERSRVLDA